MAPDRFDVGQGAQRTLAGSSVSEVNLLRAHCGSASLGPRKKRSRSDLVDPRRLASRNVKTADDLYNYKVSQFNQGRNLWSLRLL